MNKKYILTKSYDIEKLLQNKSSIGSKYYVIYYTLLLWALSWDTPHPYGRHRRKGWHPRRDSRAVNRGMLI